MNDARESSRRLAVLLRGEHAALADFLITLSEFDRMESFRRLGFANLFDYLHRELGLSRAAAHYRKVAARLVARFPEVVELARVMTEENRVEVLPRFFHCSKQEAREVAVEIRPAAVVPRRAVVTAGPFNPPLEASAVEVRPGELHMTHLDLTRTSVEPLTTELRRYHVTVSKEFLAKLKKARSGQLHVQPGATDEQVLEAALDLLLAAQVKRKSTVPGKVKRAVKERDQGKCQWPVVGGGVCGSTVRLEVDHVVPRGKGGPSTVENCRILCKPHNLEAARQVYGDDWMDRFTRGAGRDMPGRVPVAWEAVARWHPAA
jgi:hypothetical protein